MLDDLYENIGGKIKGWAKWIFIVEAIGAIITGLVFLFTDEDFILYGLLIMILGPIVAWVGTWILYAFGELVEDVHAIRNKEIPTTVNTTAMPSTTPTYTAKANGARNTGDVKPTTATPTYVVPRHQVSTSAPAPKVTHSWRCSNCGKLTTQSPCEHCGYAEEKEHIPYWCGHCGHAGPYDDRCPTCGSSLKRFNVSQN